MAERLTVEDQRANARLYGFLDIRGMEDGWNSQIKEFNFRSLLKLGQLSGTPLAGSRVIDVGCGSGDFFPVLKDEGVGEYLGIDLLSSAVERARGRYPDGAFRHGDFLIEPYNEKFDFAFLSGALTTAFPSGNPEVLMRMLARMGQVAESGFAFNYLTATEQDTTGVNLTYLYPRELVAFVCRSLFPKAEVYLETSKLGPDSQETMFVVKKPRIT